MWAAQHVNPQMLNLLGFLLKAYVSLCTPLTREPNPSVFQRTEKENITVTQWIVL